MTTPRKLNVAVVGLGFGAEFIPLWQKHPETQCYAICQRNPEKLKAMGDYFGVERQYSNFNALLKDPAVDAVHINTPIPDHSWMSIAALKAGKHVACTVPMATEIEDCRKIVELVKKTGLKYMMMETVVYAREFLFIKELYEKGELGKIQFLQASHQQDMDGWPNYWPGLPPMFYATHCVGPVAGLLRLDAEYVSCFGSGTIRKELIEKYNSPFAVKRHTSSLRTPTSVRGSIALCSTPLASIGRALMSMARRNQSSAAARARAVGCSHRETARVEDTQVCEVPRLCQAASQDHRQYTTQGVYDAKKKTHLSFAKAAATAGATRIWRTSSPQRSQRTETRSRTPANPPTGLAWASARINPRSRVAR